MMTTTGMFSKELALSAISFCNHLKYAVMFKKALDSSTHDFTVTALLMEQC